MIKKDSYLFKSLREWLIALMDIGIMMVAYLLAVIIVQFNDLSAALMIRTLTALPVVAVVSFISFFIFRTLKILWRYASTKEYLRLSLCSLTACILFAMIDFMLLHSIESGKRFSSYVNFAFLSTLFITLSRIVYGFMYSKFNATARNPKKKLTMVIGAGSSARNILEDLTRENSPFLPICLIDDDPDKLGRTVCGVQVVGTTEDIVRMAKKYAVSFIIFAIPTIDKERRKKILTECVATKCEVKVLPFVSEMLYNIDVVNQMSDIKIEDLLGREPIKFDDKDVSKYISNKTCMITGGGGSIGSELCRQIIKYHPKSIVIVDIYENTAYEIQQELKRFYGIAEDIKVEITSITDYDKMKQLMKEYHPQIIFHAAAHKHVPLMETNPEEAVKNNVFGTFNIVRLANEFEVEKFIMISTDKAVNPTNVMGATKRCCEMIVQAMAQQSKKTEFAAVRFGNVLGSHGSVIPLFREQINHGGPVTVTHKDIIRYFMTIPEAVSLVLQAGAFAHGGEVFVLDMGEPVKIVTLAENLIRMMGYRPNEEIQIEYTGLRPGEKLYEELLMNDEGLQKTENNKIFIGHQSPIDGEILNQHLKEMKIIVSKNDKDEVVKKLGEMVPTFKPDHRIFHAVVKKLDEIRGYKQSNSIPPPLEDE